jgi:hypothetical protein
MSGGEVTHAGVPGNRQGTLGDDVQAVVDLALLDQDLVVLEARTRSDGGQSP